MLPEEQRKLELKKKQVIFLTGVDVGMKLSMGIQKKMETNPTEARQDIEKFMKRLTEMKND